VAQGLGWSRSITGLFLAVWIIAYGQVRCGVLGGLAIWWDVFALRYPVNVIHYVMHDTSAK
jgi:uncharacterized membrane protein YhdT